MSSIYYIFVLLLFLAVFLAFEGIYLWWSSQHSAGAKRIESRIRALSAGGHVDKAHVSILKERLLSDTPWLERLLMRVPRVNSIDRLLQQSGLSWSVGTLAGYCTILPVLVMVLMLVLPVPVWIDLAVAVLVAVLPVLYVLRRRSQRLLQLERQLPEAADMIGRALRAGHSFSGALEMVGNEMADPIGCEFRITFDEINYGVSLNDALLNMSTRIPISDLRYFIIAVLIQRESGGNLAEIMNNIASLTRERLKLFEKIKVLSAEGRLSALILEILPFATGAMIMVVNPGFLSVLWKDPVGLKIAAGALVMMCIGMIWMRRIIRIHV